MTTYMYRIYPNRYQQALLRKHANCLNWLFNYFIMEHYINSLDFDLENIISKLKDKHPKLSKINKGVLKFVVDRASQACVATGGHPAFRSCKNFFGIRWHESWQFLEKALKTDMYGEIRINYHCKVRGIVKNVLITNSGNKWFCCVTTDHVKGN